ncbi:hypothetical protein AaE_006847 [Aphanomyces astaci]|uniref:TOG domain-containing protein n=1 Tax=Aphanomyces astaci TaxID=112090 RepID=A0A6A5AJT8_APHAT|nr:hypothetical protein AaE_006847 [Aphanomyces astaci]
MFLALAELVGPASVLAAIFGHTSVVKKPQAQFECVSEFGVSTGVEQPQDPHVAVFGTLYGQLGGAMRPLLNLDAWKPSLKDSVEVASTSTVVEEGGEEGGALGSLFGRVDVSAKITKEFLADMANDGQPRGGGGGQQEGDARVSGLIAQVCGARRCGVYELLRVVAAVRDDGAQDPVGRAELLGWTVEMTQTVAGKMDLRSLVETTIDAMSDKSTAVRHKAKLLLVEVFKSVGRDAVQVGCRGMVPANIDTVKPPARPPPRLEVGTLNANQPNPLPPPPCPRCRIFPLSKLVLPVGFQTHIAKTTIYAIWPTSARAFVDVQIVSAETTGDPAQVPNGHVNSVDFFRVPATHDELPRQTSSSVVIIVVGKVRVEATSPKPPSIPASSSPKDTLLLFVPLERLVMRQGLTVIPGELKAGKDAVKSLYSRSSIGDDVFIQEKPRQRDRRPCVAGARRGVWHMASLCVVTISSTFRHAPYVGRV